MTLITRFTGTLLSVLDHHHRLPAPPLLTPSLPATTTTTARRYNSWLCCTPLSDTAVSLSDSLVLSGVEKETSGRRFSERVSNYLSIYATYLKDLTFQLSVFRGIHAHICDVSSNSDSARMLGVFPDAQADDGADYWSIPSKRCHIAWETGFARGYALRVVATLRAIAVKVALVTRKLLAAAAITTTLRTPPPPMVSNFTSRQRPLRRYAECHCHDHPDSSPQDAYTGGFHDYRFLCHPLAHGLPHDGLVWPRMVSGAMQETGAMQGLSPGILSWPFMALRGT
ncbi:uncharacterized protein LACBIDRAFT_330610 [Laccaria bicolor S238N-H82]|uniref:Predicted protein n=1 Tax=Laccaria bicolor (strain S238N-H82 / ATCC MYA-4686) TaxID=486041 RepID=B0DLW5_LACBS|nr:uncharacterized protein LACBIDRAFT_330610 [Laccaria bicolor S238N-H82]EDR04363.1 predicted protein [Laccaria bicolor S238N-H82]|eukprot:XP_001884882.1 predicted protein [Laccaria bicolor S238N-H82]